MKERHYERNAFWMVRIQYPSSFIVRNVAGLCEIVTESAVRIEGKEMERQPRVVSYFLFIVAAMSDGGAVAGSFCAHTFSPYYAMVA